MKFGIINTTMITLAVFLSPSLSAAATDKAVARQTTASEATSSTASSKSAKVVAAPKVKLIDINSAKKKELKTLPGIGDSQAEKIIAGRPYGSKAHLITRNVVDRASYDAINKLVVAKPTRQLLDKVAALNKKKE
ncbi:MAG: helix-hairpin-helix domain-containing protein [Rhodoferax sp.]|uniref:helix-hairpin-helix domain-containing protein n=1 Tax=Rhodoferax sp. TaxID=50421 RepID=UPI003BB4FB7F|nr:helix-hairpin-helix domain-containing protein [Rhodoferax sp.]